MVKKIRKKFYKRNLPTAYDHMKISWVAPEYTRYERGIIWKILVAAAIALMAGLGVYYQAWTFSLAVLVFALVYSIVHRQKPRDVEVVLSDIGIKVGERKYPFNKIIAFWIAYHPPYLKTLNLRVSDDLALDIEIELNEQNPSEVHKFLIDKIPEKKGQPQSLSTIYARLFKI